MKEIKAIIQPGVVSKVIDALKAIPDMPGVTVSEIKGFGRARANVPHSIVEWGVAMVVKAKLETVVTDEMVRQVVEAIQKNAYTGNIGDGKIFVYDVNEVIKIRTGESGPVAI
ncbi:MAG: P-II family nitrogen regulator [Deltaproteobacteria bacterium]|nr:MAG: P-II family nitrogen regulator [Deltaproteobacteria bacterium]